jgi:hypothetical protein
MEATPLVRRVQLTALVMALLAGGVGIGAFASVRAQSDATPVTQAADVCPDELYGPDSEPWVRAELYFGTTNPETHKPFSEEEFDKFLDAEITPRFPDGLTLLTGLGQYRNSKGDIIQETSKLLIILFPTDTAAESSAKLEEVRAVYEEQFHQESVLRADASEVCTSF